MTNEREREKRALENGERMALAAGAPATKGITWLARKYAYERMARSIDPAIRIYAKRGWFWRAYSWVPFLLSFGMSSRKAFLSDTATVIGPLQFYPEDWTDIEHEVHHEGRHTRQQRWFGLGIHPWVGFLPWSIAAALLLPAGITIRFWLELDAESYAIRHKFRTGSSESWARHEIVEFAERLSGPGYLWSWPKGWAKRIATRRGDSICGQ